jgi:EAL and modified HD-GYP domain-containing signal transduction protein
MLGQREVRKWVTTAVSGALASDKPDEITKLSLLRAKFSENLAASFEMAIHAQSLFLMGLFSILDVVLEMPMYRALEIVKVTEKIAEALIDGTGEYGAVLKFVLAYESADWNEVSRLAVLNRLDVEKIFDAYINAARWYGEVVKVDEPAASE